MGLGFHYTTTNLNAFLSAAIPALLNIALACYVKVKMPNKRITNIFFIDLFISACWQASNALMRLSADANTAMFWDNILGGLGFFTAVLIVHFTILFVNPKKVENYLLILYPSYLVTLVFALLYSNFNVVSNYKYLAIWGWINMHQNGLYSISLAIFLQIHYLVAIGILTTKLFRSKRSSQFFYQLLLLDVGLVIVIGQALVTEAVLPLAFKMDPIPITPITTMIFTLGGFIAVKRYNLFVGIEIINKKNLLDAISDIVVVIGRNNDIEFINEPGERYTGYKLNYLRGKPLSTILEMEGKDGKAGPIDIVAGTFLGNGVRNVKCIMLAGNGETMSILVSSDPLYTRAKVNNVLLLCRYIDDVERAEEELRRNERRFKAIIEKSNDAMMLLNTDGTISYATPTSQNVIGYSPEEMEGTHFVKYIHPEFAERSITRFNDNYFDTNGNRASILKAIRKDGAEIWLESVAINHFNEPDINALVVVIRDITEKYNIQQEKEKTLLLFQSLIQNMKDAVLVGDPNHKVFTANKEFCEIFQLGISHEELSGADCTEIALQARHLLLDQDSFLPRIIEVIRGGKKVFHDRVDFADGRVFERNYAPIFANDGSIEAHLWQYENVTERIYHIQEINKQRAYLEQLFQASPIGIVMLDIESRIVNVNKAFELLFGFTIEEIRYEEINKIIVPIGMEEEAYQISNKSFDKNAVISEVKRKTKDGKLVDVAVIGYPIMIDNKIWGTYGIYMDISAQKESQHEILEKNEALTKINEELDKFVYSVSHDIRSPLMSILGLVNMAEDEISDPISLQYFNMVKDNVNRLDAFTMDIINYSRNARTDVDIDIVNLEGLINEIVESLKYHEEAIGVKFIVDVQGTVLFATDRSRLYTVLTNIVSNGIKYQKPNRKEGFIKISGWLEDGICTIEVEDNGEGIAYEKQHAIFDMFTRYSENSKGSGLGLYIVKENIAKINGSIAVESQPGMGTRFIISFPEMSN